MSRYSRIFIALTILLSGLALIPQVGIFAGVVSWQRFAGAYEDVVTVNRARYRDGDLEVRANSTAGGTPTLTVYRTADNSFIGTLVFNGSDHRGEFSVGSNPQVITVRSSLGGESTVLVTDGSGTPITVTPSATVTPGGPTNTPSPTNTPGGPTNTPTPGPSPTATGTNTPGPSPTATSTHTPGPSPTATGTNTPGPSPTATSTHTPGPSPTATSTHTPGPSPTATSTHTPGPSPTNTPGGPTETPSPTNTPGGPTETPTATITPGGPTLTPTATPPSNAETLYLPFVMQTAAGNSGQ